MKPPAINGHRIPGFSDSRQQHHESVQRRHYLRRPLRFVIMFSMVIVSCRQWIILSNATIKMSAFSSVSVMTPQPKMLSRQQNPAILSQASIVPFRKWAYAFLVGGARSTRPG
jgi:hypothetical protein